MSRRSSASRFARAKAEKSTWARASAMPVASSIQLDLLRIDPLDHVEVIVEAPRLTDHFTEHFRQVDVVQAFSPSRSGLCSRLGCEN